MLLPAFHRYSNLKPTYEGWIQEYGDNTIGDSYEDLKPTYEGWILLLLLQEFHIFLIFKAYL